MKNILALCASIALLAACNAHTSETYSKIDTNSKSITVPIGGGGLKGALKKELVQAGWKMKVYQGPSVTEGHMGSRTKLTHYDTFNTRYSLYMESRQVDLCFNLQPMVRYEISLIDNKYGAEAITMEGTGCTGKIAKDFAAKLSGKS